MIEVKIEARKILDEINVNFKQYHNGYKTYFSYSECIDEEYSIKKRIKMLRQKLNSLQAQKILKHGSNE